MSALPSSDAPAPSAVQNAAAAGRKTELASEAGSADPSSRDLRGAADAAAIPAARILGPADPGARGYALIIHAGAGSRPSPLPAEREAEARAGLESAYRAGEKVLAEGGSALDAVTAAVVAMEDDEQFNCGRGAALTDTGEAEMDACVMSGDGRAGAVAGSRYARNPVLAARAVRERTTHVLIMQPERDRVTGWGLRVEEPAYFVTEKRRAQLARNLAAHRTGPKHGTVGAVALDGQGNLAAATSTGGVTAQEAGRVGDTPIVGAGTFARNGSVAISCTGLGEAFIEGSVAHEIDARMRLVRQDVGAAACAALDDEVRPRGADGGLIALDAAGHAVVVLDSAAIYAAYRDGDELVTLV